MPGPTVLTIGNFDAVHLGHQALVSAARERAGKQGRVLVLAFDPHPASILRPRDVPPRLTDWPRREALLRDAGVDEIIRLEPSAEILGTSPEDFIASLAARYRPRALVEGPDFRFGRQRRGDVRLLADLGRTHGFETLIVPPVEATLDDLSVVTVSSSLVRWMLGHGRVRDAQRLLGRFYEIRGEVVEGEKRGRRLGVPTANIAADTMLPGDGVYFGQATGPDGRLFPAAINVGVKPTFGPARRGCEVHLIDAGVPANAYGWWCTVAFHGFLRGELRFDGPEAVAAQIRRDIGRARELLTKRAIAS